MDNDDICLTLCLLFLKCRPDFGPPAVCGQPCLSFLFFYIIQLPFDLDGTVRAAAPAAPRSRPQAGSLLYQTQDGHTRLLTAGQGQIHSQ